MDLISELKIFGSLTNATYRILSTTHLPVSLMLMYNDGTYYWHESNCISYNYNHRYEYFNTIDRFKYKLKNELDSVEEKSKLYYIIALDHGMSGYASVFYKDIDISPDNYMSESEHFLNQFDGRYIRRNKLNNMDLSYTRLLPELIKIIKQYDEI